MTDADRAGTAQAPELTVELGDDHVATLEFNRPPGESLLGRPDRPDR